MAEPVGTVPADLGARVAWMYLATVAAGAVGGLLALVAYQVVNPLACRVTDEETVELALSCSLAWGAILMLLGFVVAFIGSLALFKLERRLAAWLAMLAGLLWLLVGLTGIGQWWWNLALALLPALVAVASAPWTTSPKPPLAQTTVLSALVLAALGVLTWQVVG